VTTFLGLGANVARETYLKTYLGSELAKNKSSVSNSTLLRAIEPLHPKKSISMKIVEPCLSKEAIEQVNITTNNQNYELVIEGAGNFDVCRTKLLEFLDPKREVLAKCGSNSTSCPLKQLQETSISFKDTEFYGFSELWYTLEDVLRLGGQYNFFKFKEAAAEYCGTSWSILESRYNRKLYPKADKDRLIHECFKSVWVMALLHDGLKMPNSYNKYKSVMNLGGSTVQWTLGALLYRTRFFPLLSIEKSNGDPALNQVMKAPVASTSNNFVNHALFFLCMCAVLASIAVYLKHLHKLVNSNNLIGVTINNSSMTRDLEKVRTELEEPLLDNIVCS